MSASRSVPFTLVDVFTDTPLAGNPLAVVPDADGVPESLLARIAREFNQSETTFLVRPTRPPADSRLRSFTPAGVEVFGAGHNALGAWWWLAASGRVPLVEPCTRCRQQLGDQVLSVAIQVSGGQPAAVVMDQQAPRFGAIVADVSRLADALGIPAGWLGPGGFPPQAVSTGTPHLLVAMDEPEHLTKVRPDPARLRDVVMQAGAQGCYVFVATPNQPTAARARFFNPVAGIAEDPATGSAAGPLACFLKHHGLIQGDLVRIAQGAETGRPSELLVDLREGVRLQGRAVVVAEGVLHLPA